MSAAYDFIRQLVHKRSAIVLEDEKDYLIESRLGPLIKQEGLGSFGGLVEHLKQNERGRIGVQVVEAMTTNETSFFRDTHPFETLRTIILPRLLEARAVTRTLRIWSAAASTGQEALSIAMVLRDAVKDLGQWDVKILATDLNRAVIARAATGVYKQLEVNRGLPARHLSQHFERCGADWKAKPHLLEMVTFRELNLLDRWRGVGQQDLVFMRNVLIYFDLPTRRTILRNVSRLLPADGYLFLGGAETAVNSDDRLRSTRFGTSLAYQPNAGDAHVAR
jgi:chemotaxis protein methyltransferase CheR